MAELLDKCAATHGERIGGGGERWAEEGESLISARAPKARTEGEALIFQERNNNEQNKAEQTAANTPQRVSKHGGRGAATERAFLRGRELHAPFRPCRRACVDCDRFAAHKLAANHIAHAPALVE